MLLHLSPQGDSRGGKEKEEEEHIYISGKHMLSPLRKVRV
jgi:hypothetical protein